MNRLFCGIDMGTRSSSICVIDVEKKVVHRWHGRNDAICEELRRLEGELHCVVEAGPLAESYCNAIEQIGAQIEIVDSHHTKSLLRGKKKTDKIDAQILAELCLMGWYKPVYRKSSKARTQRVIVSSRNKLVQVSTQLKNSIRGLLKSLGIVLPASCEGKEFCKQVTQAIKKLSEDLKESIKDLLAMWHVAHEKQSKGYKKLRRLARKDKVARRLMTVPGVGPATALAFTAAIANPTRFKDPKQVASYLGLAPTVHQSGDTQFHGRISKKGDKLLRWLLVEAAGVMLTRVKRSFPLREWGLRLEEAKGHAKATVALARRLSELLLVLWKTECDFKYDAV